MIFQSTFEQFNGVNEDLLEGVTIADYSECGSVMEAAMDMMQESAINWENFNRAIATTEARYLRENGVPMEYLEENVKELISGGIKIVQGWFSKAMGLIQRAMSAVSNWVKDKVSFVKQHEVQLKANPAWPAKAAFRGYDFNKVTSNMDKMNMITLSASENYADGATDSITSAVKAWGVVDGKATVANIKKSIMSGTEIEINGSTAMSPTTCLSELKDARNTIKEFQKLRSSVKKTASDTIAILKKQETKVKAAKDATADEKKDARSQSKSNEKAIHSLISICNKMASANTAMLTAKISVCNDYIRQIDRIAKVYVKGGNKDVRDAQKAERKAQLGESNIFGFDSALA